MDITDTAPSGAVFHFVQKSGLRLSFYKIMVDRKEGEAAYSK
jgi:hypothetical protein